MRSASRWRSSQPVADCKRRVIDVSGDGTPNAGSEVRAARLAAERAGVTINGIAIEGMGLAITTFFDRAVITTDGFVMTARGHREYPRAIRAKNPARDRPRPRLTAWLRPCAFGLRRRPSHRPSGGHGARPLRRCA